MRKFLLSILIKDFSYLHVKNYTKIYLNLIEFFDHVLIAGDEAKLTLLKQADKLTLEDINSIADFGSDIVQTHNKKGKLSSRTLVFLFFRDGINQGKIDSILSLEVFRKSKFAPVIVDETNNRLIYNKWKIPIAFLAELNQIQKKISSSSPEKIREIETEPLSLEEIKNIGKIEGFRKALFDSRPYATWVLLFINAAVWVYMALHNGPDSSETLIDMGAKVAPLIWQGQLWRLITPAFLHVNLLHLATNCVVIFFIGPILEAMLGRWRFVFVYLMGGLLGNLLSVRFSPYLSAGASSSVFGLLGALLIYGYNYRRFIPRNFYKIISLYIFPLLIYNLAIGFLYPHLDNFAHIGGLLGGILSAGILSVEYPRNLKKNVKTPLLAGWSVLMLILVFLAFRPYPEAYKIFYFIRGNIESNRSNYVPAISYYKQSLQLEPDFQNARESLARTYAALGLKYYNKGKYNQAFIYLSEAIQNLEINRENNKLLFFIYEKLGQCYDQKNINEAAINSFKKALVFYPFVSPVYKNLSRQYLILSRKALLDGSFSRAIELGNLSLKNDNISSGMNLLLEKFPGIFDYNSLTVRFQLGYLYFLDMNFNEAVRLWKQGGELIFGKIQSRERIETFIFKNLWYGPKIIYLPGNFDYQALNRAISGHKILVKSGDYEKAQKYFKQALEISPEFTPALVSLAKIQLYLNNFEEAEKLLSRADEIDSENWEINTVSAMVELEKGNYNEAFQLVNASLEKKPDYPMGLATKAEIFKQQGDEKEAMRYFEKALDNYPQQAVWQAKLAFEYKKAGDFKNFFNAANSALTYAENQGRLQLELLIRSLLARTGEEI
ncbi:MAG: rhomboid family intramembrane serine protease [Vulcanimicrobiota bacterium]